MYIHSTQFYSETF